jgi:hypothetical protein
MGLFFSRKNVWQEPANKMVDYCLSLTDIAQEILLPSKPELKIWLTDNNANKWKFYMAIISIGVNYGFTQSKMSREDSRALLDSIKERISKEPRLGWEAITYFDRFMSAWWGLAHYPDPDNLDLGAFIGVWFVKSIGVPDAKQCDIVLLRGIAAYMAGPHFPKNFGPRPQSCSLNKSTSA